MTPAAESSSGLGTGFRSHAPCSSACTHTYHTLIASVGCLTFRQAEKCSGLIPSEDSPPAAGYADAAQPAPSSFLGVPHTSTHKIELQHSTPSLLFPMSSLSLPPLMQGPQPRRGAYLPFFPLSLCHLIPSSVETTYLNICLRSILSYLYYCLTPSPRFAW